MSKSKFCILLYCTDTDPKNFSCYGPLWPHLMKYIKTYENGKFTITSDIIEARRFEDDEECDACMDAMIHEGATYIPVWDYDDEIEMLEFKRQRNEVESFKYRGYGYVIDFPLKDKDKAIRNILEHPVTQALHYPNEHWSRNGKLQPSLMNRTIKEFYINKFGYDPLNF